jgi:hypothetical protein
MTRGTRPCVPTLPAYADQRPALHARRDDPAHAAGSAHLFGWSFQEMEDQGDQSLVLRWFCRQSWQETPDDTTLIQLRPHPATRDAASARRAHRRAGPTGQGHAGTQGAPGCGPLMQTTIHHPTDSGRHGGPRARAQPAGPGDASRAGAAVVPFPPAHRLAGRPAPAPATALGWGRQGSRAAAAFHAVGRGHQAEGAAGHDGGRGAVPDHRGVVGSAGR